MELPPLDLVGTAWLASKSVYCLDVDAFLRQCDHPFENWEVCRVRGPETGRFAVFWTSTSIYVAVRGTDNLDDLQQDLQVSLTVTPYGLAHSGFFERMQQLPFQRLLALSRSDERPIVFCGHSLGGAVASLAAVHLRSLLHKQNQNRYAERVKCVTFGAPLIGDESIAACMQPDSFWHLFAPRDLIPRALSVASQLSAQLLKRLAKALSSNEGVITEVLQQIRTAADQAYFPGGTLLLVDADNLSNLPVDEFHQFARNLDIPILEYISFANHRNHAYDNCIRKVVGTLSFQNTPRNKPAKLFPQIHLVKVIQQETFSLIQLHGEHLNDIDHVACSRAASLGEREISLSDDKCIVFKHKGNSPFRGENRVRLGVSLWNYDGPRFEFQAPVQEHEVTADVNAVLTQALLLYACSIHDPEVRLWQDLRKGISAFLDSTPIEGRLFLLATRCSRSAVAALVHEKLEEIRGPLDDNVVHQAFESSTIQECEEQLTSACVSTNAGEHSEAECRARVHQAVNFAYSTVIDQLNNCPAEYLQASYSNYYAAQLIHTNLKDIIRFGGEAYRERIDALELFEKFRLPSTSDRINGTTTRDSHAILAELAGTLANMDESLQGRGTVTSPEFYQNYRRWQRQLQNVIAAVTLSLGFVQRTASGKGNSLDGLLCWLKGVFGTGGAVAGQAGVAAARSTLATAAAKGAVQLASTVPVQSAKSVAFASVATTGAVGLLATVAPAVVDYLASPAPVTCVEDIREQRSPTTRSLRQALQSGAKLSAIPFVAMNRAMNYLCSTFFQSAARSTATAWADLSRMTQDIYAVDLPAWSTYSELVVWLYKEGFGRQFGTYDSALEAEGAIVNCLLDAGISIDNIADLSAERWSEVFRNCPFETEIEPPYRPLICCRLRMIVAIHSLRSVLSDTLIVTIRGASKTGKTSVSNWIARRLGYGGSIEAAGYGRHKQSLFPRVHCCRNNEFSQYIAVVDTVGLTDQNKFMDELAQDFLKYSAAQVVVTNFNAPEAAHYGLANYTRNLKSIPTLVPPCLTLFTHVDLLGNTVETPDGPSQTDIGVVLHQDLVESEYRQESRSIRETPCMFPRWFHSVASEQNVRADLWYDRQGHVTRFPLDSTAEFAAGGNLAPHIKIHRPLDVVAWVKFWLRRTIGYFPDPYVRISDGTCTQTFMLGCLDRFQTRTALLTAIAQESPEFQPRLASASLDPEHKLPSSGRIDIENMSIEWRFYDGTR